MFEKTFRLLAIKFSWYSVCFTLSYRLNLVIQINTDEF